MGEHETMDLLTASALVREAQENARRALRVRLPPLYAVWGMAWLVGLGGMWLSVRGQQPYRGPALGAGLLLAALLVSAMLVTVVVVGRSTAGVRGNSELQRRIYGWSWLVGFAALFAVEQAVASNGASHAAMGVLGAAGPLLVTGLIYVLGAALWLDRPMFALGIWLAVVAVAGAWTGPVTVLLVGALAGGGGFLLVAAVLARSGRS
jgi:hypothetical protein